MATFSMAGDRNYEQRHANMELNPRPIQLEGLHVRLEPLAISHAAPLYAAYCLDPSVWQYLTVAPPISEAAMLAMIETQLAAQDQGRLIPFAQVAVRSGMAVGVTTFMNISAQDRGLEIGGTWLGRPYQRSGINTEAKYLLLRHAFEYLYAVRVQLKTDGRNLQSQRAIERLGATREGVLRKHMLSQHCFIRDTVMYSIIDSEWPIVKERLERMLGA